LSDDEPTVQLRISKLPIEIAFRWWHADGGEKAEARAEDGTMVPVDPAAARAAVGDPERFQRLSDAEKMAIAAAVARRGRQ